ncbi:SpoIIE family protein phosphatase [Gandjariella thermophila]|uniref:Transcription antitermination regulator n=1 Tax=Gandjariella thermophila TaxID=1931992 RepID=A0A4D4J1L3_9PSEU|nr:SpoIIE family protein phosphatase [Gandjariella thermophila]GDY29050.1 transcription antitermination regulator [Gandjariella thermophila]
MALAATVSRLRTEVEELRHALRTQAVVEQAKGMLAAEFDCTPDEALAHLAELAAHNSASLLEVSAALLGASAPPELPEWGDAAAPHSILAFDPDRYVRDARGEPPPELAAGVGDPTAGAAPPEAAGYHVAVAALDSATTADELAGALRDAARLAAGADAALLALLEPDGSLRLVGSAGMPPRIAMEWQRVPAHVNTAMSWAARTGQPLWLPRYAEAKDRFVLIGEPEHHWMSRAAIPIVLRGVVIGVAGLLWERERSFDERERRYLSQLGQACGRRLPAVVGADAAPPLPGWLDWVQLLLDGLPGSVAFATPVRDAAGSVVDFEVRAVSRDAVDFAGRPAEGMIGRRMLERYPGTVPAGLWRACLATFASGVGRDIGPVEYSGTAADEPRSAALTVRLSKFCDGLLVAWSRQEEQRQHERRLSLVQRLANLGWGEWDLIGNRISWSEQVYRIFDRDVESGPISLEELTSLVLPDDLPVLSNVLDALLERGRRVETRFRIRVRTGVRHLRVVVEPVLDGTSRPVAVHGILQDVTTEHRAQEQLSALQRKLTAQSRDLAEGHRLATTLQHALLPLPRGAFALPGLRVAVRYLTAEQVANVGGDWYHARELPDGSVLLAVGDVVGHGVPAAATMAELRNALAGAAVVTGRPELVLAALNELLVAKSDGSLATAVVCRYEPASRTLTWAQAGHLAPLLSRGEKAESLPRPPGVMLGVVDRAQYVSTSVRLRPDDLLLLYTDGMVEDRRDDVLTGISRLGGSLRRLRAETADDLTGLLARLRRANPADDACALAVHVRADGA